MNYYQHEKPNCNFKILNQTLATSSQNEVSFLIPP